MTDPGATTIRVGVPETGPGSYEIRVRRGGLADLGELCRDTAPAHRYAVIADDRVAGLYGEAALASLAGAGAEAELLTFPEGEASKSRERWAELTESLLERGHGRDSAIVALGGGVTGDLAGFVAATYMRGIPVVQTPTSLLAMLDSSVGGKTGVDVPAGKNLVGAFHPPAAVLVDPDLLETLPGRQLRAGLVEAVKVAAIADAGLFEWLEARAARLVKGDPVSLEELVVRAVGLKARIVEEDPRERGLRAVLNFGHTIGHAVERCGGYRSLHGEAVACGLVIESEIGREAGLTEPGTPPRISALLTSCGLEERMREALAAVPGPEELLDATSRDKKSRAGQVRVVLPEGIGRVALAEGGGYTHPLDPEIAGFCVASALYAGEGRKQI